MNSSLIESENERKNVNNYVVDDVWENIINELIDEYGTRDVGGREIKKK